MDEYEIITGDLRALLSCHECGGDGDLVGIAESMPPTYRFICDECFGVDE